MTTEETTTGKKGGICIAIDWTDGDIDSEDAFRRSSPDRGVPPPSASRKRNRKRTELARSSRDLSGTRIRIDVSFTSPPSSALKEKGGVSVEVRTSADRSGGVPFASLRPVAAKGTKVRKDAAAAEGEIFSGMSNEALRREVAGMSDGESRREIAGLRSALHRFQPSLERLRPRLEADARKRKANAYSRSSSDRSGGDVYSVSPPLAAAASKGTKARRDAAAAEGEFYSGRSNDSLRRDIADMSDDELRRNIAQIPKFGRLLTQEKRERGERLLPLLEAEARRRRIRTDVLKDGDGRSRAASSMQDVYTFAIEDELTEDASRKYFPKPSTIHMTKKNYGMLGVQTRRSSNQTVPRKPIAVDKMYSSRPSPTALCGHTLRVRAVGPKEHGNEKSWHNENNLYRNFAKRRKAHHEGSSLLHQKVNDDVVLLDDEDVQPDETVDYVVPDKWKDLKIYYPPSVDPEAVELSSLDIRCLNPGVYLSSPVINYFIQYIKRAEMHNEYGTEKFYMFNTYFYSKLQEALLDKGKFLKLRRWWKGVNIFQRGYIILPIHGTSHWSLIIVCMPAKDSNSGPIILHLDSIAIHPSAEIFDTVGRYLEEEWCHVRKNPPSDISISDTVWQDLPSNIQREKVEVPGQNNSYDSGIFMLYYIREFIRQAPERFTRDSLDMLSRSWFRSEDTSGLRNTIRGQLLELFANARVDDVMPEAAASAGSDECIMKEGESEAAVTPGDGSGMAAVGGGDTGTRNEEDFMEIISLEGSPSTTGRSDGRIGDCALSEAATLSDSVKDAADDDTMKVDSDGLKTEQDIEILPSGSSKNSEEAMRGLPGLDVYGADTMKIDSDSSKAEQDIEILPSCSSKSSEVIRGLPDSCGSDVEEVDHRSWKAKKPHFCQIS